MTGGRYIFSSRIHDRLGWSVSRPWQYHVHITFSTKHLFSTPAGALCPWSPSYNTCMQHRTEFAPSKTKAVLLPVSSVLSPLLPYVCGMVLRTRASMCYACTLYVVHRISYLVVTWACTKDTYQVLSLADGKGNCHLDNVEVGRGEQ